MKWSLGLKGLVLGLALSTFAACQPAETEGEAAPASETSAAAEAPAADATEAEGETVDSVIPNPAVESEAKQILGAMSRGQQAFHLEQGAFASTIEDLAVGIQPETNNYTYTIVSADDKAAKMTATAKVEGIASFGAIVALEEDFSNRLICQTDEPSQTPPDVVDLSGCPAGSSELK